MFSILCNFLKYKKKTRYLPKAGNNSVTKRLFIAVFGGFPPAKVTIPLKLTIFFL